MGRSRTRFAAAILGVLALAGVAALLLAPDIALAQSPTQDSRSGHGDMWNPNWMRRDMWGSDQMGPDMRPRMMRHWTFMHQGVPAAHGGARNPHSPDPKTIGEGSALYQKNCASCHGATGMGDGARAHALNPSPALLAYMIQMPMTVDEYMLWTISDGGKAFGTAMPAFKDILTKDQIWRIVTYMRAGFPTGQAQQ